MSDFFSNGPKWNDFDTEQTLPINPSISSDDFDKTISLLLDSNKPLDKPKPKHKPVAKPEPAAVDISITEAVDKVNNLAEGLKENSNQTRGGSESKAVAGTGLGTTIPDFSKETAIPEQRNKESIETEKKPVGKRIDEAFPIEEGDMLGKSDKHILPDGDGSGSDNRMNIILASTAGLGLILGGSALWMTLTASGDIQSAEQRIQNSLSASTIRQSKEIVDIKQRLIKIERRLTGTPTIEAGAPLAMEPKQPETGSTETTKSTMPAMESKAEAAKPAIADKSDAPTHPVEATDTSTEVAKATETAAESQSGTAVKAETKAKPAVKSGDWVINISSHANRTSANKEMERLNQSGMDAEVHEASIRDKIWYRVQIFGFATKYAAKARLDEIEHQYGIKGAWIGKR